MKNCGKCICVSVVKQNKFVIESWWWTIFNIHLSDNRQYYERPDRMLFVFDQGLFILLQLEVAYLESDIEYKPKRINLCPERKEENRKRSRDYCYKWNTK